MTRFPVNVAVTARGDLTLEGALTSPDGTRLMTTPNVTLTVGDTVTYNFGYLELAGITSADVELGIADQSTLFRAVRELLTHSGVARVYTGETRLEGDELLPRLGTGLAYHLTVPADLIDQLSALVQRPSPTRGGGTHITIELA